MNGVAKMSIWKVPQRTATETNVTPVAFAFAVEAALGFVSESKLDMKSNRNTNVPQRLGRAINRKIAIPEIQISFVRLERTSLFIFIS